MNVQTEYIVAVTVSYMHTCIASEIYSVTVAWHAQSGRQSYKNRPDLFPDHIQYKATGSGLSFPCLLCVIVYFILLIC